jgi:hypothetical protein
MKLKLNPDKINVRVVLLLSLGMVSFFILIFVKFLIPDTFLRLESTNSDSGLIISANEIIYIDISPIKRKKRERQALEIIVQNKPYKIWLTDIYDKKYWRIIENPDNIGMMMKYNYIDRLLHDGVLHNPKRIMINDREIIEFDRDKNEAKYAMIFMLILFIPALIFFFLCLWTYLDKLLKRDIERLKRIIIKE